MTSALNRKFDLLCRSGTCPAYLMDVLSLLVAHANDTELFKSECRSAEVATSSRGAAPVTVTPTTSTAPARAAAEEDAAERRLALVRKQAEDPEELDAAIRASHETVLLAAEHSLRTYAENLKRANDIALAATEKQLRALRVETRAELEQFKKLALTSTVEQTRNELDLLRVDWLTDTRGEVEQLRESVHEVGLAAQAEVHDITSSYTQFVVDTHAALAGAPVVEAHSAAASSLLLEEQVETILRCMANRDDVVVLEERVRSLEKSSARLASHGGEMGTGGTAAAAATATATAAAAAAPPLVPPEEVRPTRRMSSRAVDQDAAAAKPAEAPPANPAAAPSSAVPSVKTASTCGDRVGLTVQTGRNGLCVSAVAPDSPALQKNIAIGSIVSHVGRTHVATVDDYTQAVAEAGAVDGATIKLTIYDPQSARVRVVSF